MSQGKALREKVSRTSHAEWAAPSARPDVIKDFATALGAPVFLNGMARGGLPTNHPSLLSRSRKFASPTPAPELSA